MNKILIYCKYLLIRYLISWRMLAVLIVTVLTMDSFMAPIREFCTDMDINVSAWGYALIWDNKYVGICFALIYILGISNFPENRAQERYAISRIGTSYWMKAQAIFLVFMGWIYAAALFLVQSMLLLKVMEFGSSWGEGWSSLVNGNIAYNYDILILMPRKVISNYSPFRANVLVFVIMGLLWGMFGLLILWLNTYSGYLGSMAATAVVLVSLAAERYETLFRYSPLNWIQLNNHYSLTNVENPKVYYIISVLICLTALFALLAENRVLSTQEDNRRK